MNVQITTDSTCDLGEHTKNRGIGVMPLLVILGNDSFHDGVDIAPQDIFNYVNETNTLPKTAAPSITDYEEFFERYVKEGKTVIHFSISQKASSSYSYALAAAEKFAGKVFVVDSKGLSSGQGLLVLKAADLLDEGKSAEELVSICNELAPKVNTSFIPDRLDYLFKGGRCSRMTMYGANLLKIHPLIAMEDGQLLSKAKYRGSMEKCIRNYIADLKTQYPSYDKTRCFITHSCADEELVQAAKECVAQSFEFEQVIETVAGSVITGHCGRNTLGVLFITE